MFRNGKAEVPDDVSESQPLLSADNHTIDVSQWQPVAYIPEQSDEAQLAIDALKVALLIHRIPLIDMFALRLVSRELNHAVVTQAQICVNAQPRRFMPFNEINRVMNECSAYEDILPPSGLIKASNPSYLQGRACLFFSLLSGPSSLGLGTTGCLSLPYSGVPMIIASGLLGALSVGSVIYQIVSCRYAVGYDREVQTHYEDVLKPAFAEVRGLGLPLAGNVRNVSSILANARSTLFAINDGCGQKPPAQLPPMSYDV